MQGTGKHEINASISLLIKFFDIYDGRDLSSSDMNQSSSFGVHVQSFDDNTRKQVHIPYNQDVPIHEEKNDSRSIRFICQ